MSTPAAAEPGPIKAPFPYPGGKAKVADLVWSRIGNVDNAIEPFCGSAAWVLRRPAGHFADGYRVETLNDANHYVVNFWRAVTADPEEVARHADRPVTEADLHASHKWLVRSVAAEKFRAAMTSDPFHYDAKIAGYWVHGACCWIGGAWCHDGHVGDRAMPQIDQSKGYLKIGKTSTDREQPPGLSSGLGRGQTAAHQQRGPVIAAPNSARGLGVNGRPNLADAYDVGRGVNGGAAALASKVPRLGARFGQMDGPGVLDPTVGTCEARREWLVSWMRRLADRLRLVRTCYGHWSRVCDSDSTLTRLGTVGVFLDPPYPANRADTGAKSRDPNLYATDKVADLDALRDEVLDWCRRWGGNPAIRVAVCGYEGDGYERLLGLGWTEYAWEAGGGYANQRRKGAGKSENAKRERVWFSPACVRPTEAPSLFAGLTD